MKLAQEQAFEESLLADRQKVSICSLCAQLAMVSL